MQPTSEPVAPRPPGSPSPPVPAPRQPVFYTAAETSEIVRLDESTLYRHLRNGTFPGIKIGGRYVVPCAVLERLIADVLATGRCVDLAEWTARWRADQEPVAPRFPAGQQATEFGPEHTSATASGFATAAVVTSTARRHQESGG